MNKRIQELLIEAHKQTNGGIYNGHLSEWTEKFAELIVRECADIATINQYQSYTPGHYVLKHFGVE
jgi:hypothetical protein